ncbi:glycerol kinase GlpK [Niveispirillum irakense]|uniref:glycerol kinase GlpK n=1 Tax=Niveispirillum irakense TaxID=34011 RepID=UPI000420061A|nr:glycerol kinase GlpK [Niveispirillum irakense]
MSDHILAIDQGTTGTTVIIFDRETHIAGRAYAEFPQYYPQAGWVEHDGLEIWRVTLETVAQALRAAKLRPESLRAIGITNQRETVMAWNRHTGQPVHRAIVWQDRRTAAFCDTLRADPAITAMIREKTGLVVDPYFSATKMRWLLENVPGLREGAEKGDILFGTIDSWLIWNLTGGALHVTDPSNAARTQLFDIHTGCWDDTLLAMMGVPACALPQIASSSGILGYTVESGFLGVAGIPIAGVAGDQQAALFGQACHGPGLAKNTYGTGSFLLMHTGTQTLRDPGPLLSTVAWRIGDQPLEHALEGAIFVTGAAVQWLRDGLGLIASAAETEALARSLSDNDGVYFVPALTGLGAPHWDPYARGMIAGLTRGTSRAHLARAALEAMAYQTRDVVRAIEAQTGIALTELRADGGAVGNDFLMQFQADLLDVPVEVPQIAETTALGAAYLAGLATGFWQSRAEIRSTWKLAKRFEPSMAPAERDRLYQRWTRALEQARGWALD